MVSLADSLWHRNRVLAEAALEHTFVQGIASGELAPATFAHYVGQDAAFLSHSEQSYLVSCTIRFMRKHHGNQAVQ